MRVTTKLYTVAMDVWTISQWHPLFLFWGGRGRRRSRQGRRWQREFGFEGKRNPQQQERRQGEQQQPRQWWEQQHLLRRPQQEETPSSLSHDADGADGDDDGADDRRRRPGQCRWAWPPSARILNPYNPFPAVGGQGGNLQED